MKLTKSDKDYLLKIGYPEEDFSQIEKATNKTVYECTGSSDGSFENYHKEKISTEKAIELLGRETYLNGISRSAFHWSASREIEGTNETIYFDSSRLFK